MTEPVEIFDFLPRESCRDLIEVHRAWVPSPEPDKPPTADYSADYWHERSLSFMHIRDSLVREVMKGAAIRAKELAEELFKVRLFLDYMDLVKWPAGMAMPVHRDNVHDYCRHRTVSALIYLNEDFAGGQTYFPGVGTITPEDGKLLLFESGVEHGVREIVAGTRYTFPLWFTTDEAKAGYEHFL